MLFVELSVTGIFVGLAGGLFGMGGGIVLIPVLTELYGPDQHRYQAASLIVNVFVAVPAVFQHVRAKAMDWPAVGRLIPPAILAVVGGVILSEAELFADTGEARLRLCFAAFVFFAAVVEAYRAIVPPSAGPRTDRFSMGGLVATAIAVPTGLISGLLGVGGGVIAVPLQRRVLRIPLPNAIANSAAMIIAVSFVGAVAKNYAYAAERGASLDAAWLALLVAPAAVIGSLIGSRLTHRLPLGVLRLLFMGLLVLAAVRMGFGSIQELG